LVSLKGDERFTLHTTLEYVLLPRRRNAAFLFASAMAGRCVCVCGAEKTMTNQYGFGGQRTSAEPPVFDTLTGKPKGGEERGDLTWGIWWSCCCCPAR